MLKMVCLCRKYLPLGFPAESQGGLLCKCRGFMGRVAARVPVGIAHQKTASSRCQSREGGSECGV